jgi:hypothetical protein
MGLLDLAPDWVTLRDTTQEGLPVVVLLDRAVATTAPHADCPLQVAVAVQLSPTEDGLPAEADRPNLRDLEQRLVDAAAGEARLVAVMTLEGVREWLLYGSSGEWTAPFVAAGISCIVTEDPSYTGLLELSGAV